ncbi:MAG: acetoacetate--CoA ligase [Pseudomonadota bacterium]
MTQAPLWQPTSDRVESANLTSFTRYLEQQHNVQLPDYPSLWQWSVDNPADFWSSIWDACGLIGEKGNLVVNHEEQMPGAEWFPEARLNYAENLLRTESDNVAIIFWGEDQTKRELSFNQLRLLVSQCQRALIRAGIGKGDRVAGYVANTPEAIVAMLAATSIGAVWCSASPDFGVDGVLDRFDQISPSLVFCTDGYYYNGKWVDCMEKNHAVMERLSKPCIHVVIPYQDPTQTMDNCWKDFLSIGSPGPLEFERVPFAHPLFVMFSSGTTGKPKCIVHSVGGTLIQHLKEHQLHSDIKPADRLFYFTTCGWMMWNWLVSALASKATLVLYDGSPFAGSQVLLFDLAEQHQVTHFGTSAKFIEACNKAGLHPQESHDLSHLRSLFSTGSPLAPESFRYVYEKIKSDVHLASISGGTDIISCFALGNPTLPVWIGELQCLGLGMAVDAFDPAGKPTRSDKGDLVCTKPFPCMPIGFWNDDDGARYKAAYFERFENVWCHGDFVEITEHNGMIIHGRSDAVLNPGGVRIGTAEIYRQVEKIDAVVESIVIGQQWQDDTRVVLFVVLRDGEDLNEELAHTIRTQIRQHATPRHVPAKIVQVTDIPRTKSGKIVELAVRDVVHGRPVINTESLANPEALRYFENRPELSV